MAGEPEAAAVLRGRVDAAAAALGLRPAHGHQDTRLPRAPRVHQLRDIQEDQTYHAENREGRHHR